MTEKNYGGANSFGYKGSSAQKSGSSASSVKSDKKEKKEVVKTAISQDVIDCYLKAGKICAEVREYTKKIVKKDVNVLEIAEKIEAKIEELGGSNAFPVNISIDEVAAHYTPILDDKIVASGLFKVDFGVEVDGYIADNAISFDLTDDKRYTEMIKVNEKALNDALDLLEIGSSVKVIGNTISKVVSDSGYKIITNLSGHSLNQDDLHAGLTISNLPNQNEFPLEDIAIAIEPFLTTGKGEIYEGKPSEIYILQADKLPRDRDARKVLEFIKENYRTKPFCKRWLQKAGLPKVNFALSMLVRDGILHNFGVLIEKDKKPVSQAEHSVLFADKVYVYTRK
ncbi:Methionine aminopeptidase [uncultured archaeon]|nr:Methionine aminopeptidase [uncultured archaeon]